MKVSVTVTLKEDVLDPQGKVVKQTLKNMGYSNIQSVRQGKYFEIEVEESDEKNIKKNIEQIGKIQKDEIYMEKELKININELIELNNNWFRKYIA